MHKYRVSTTLNNSQNEGPEAAPRTEIKAPAQGTLFQPLNRFPCYIGISRHRLDRQFRVADDTGVDGNKPVSGQLRADPPSPARRRGLSLVRFHLAHRGDKLSAFSCSSAQRV